MTSLPSGMGASGSEGIGGPEPDFWRWSRVGTREPSLVMGVSILGVQGHQPAVLGTTKQWVPGEEKISMEVKRVSHPVGDPPGVGAVEQELRDTKLWSAGSER